MSTNKLKLWYQQPAVQWVEALPLGNGRLGAMVFGGVAQERLQLNEETLWSGAMHDWNTHGAQDALPALRQAIFAGSYREADRLAKQLQGPFTQSYQPLGDLHLTFAHPDVPSAYQRELDLETAIATTRYTVAGATFTRELFVSAPDQVIVLRLTCDQPGQLTCTARFSSKLRHQTRAADKETLLLTGKAPAHVEPSYRDIAPAVVYAESDDGAGMHFAACLRAVVSGGQVQIAADQLEISQADAVTLILSAATGFIGYDQSPGLPPAAVGERVSGVANRACTQPYANLRSRHLADYQQLFQRVALDLGETAAVDLPTDTRIRHFKTADDPQLLTLLFQYGRYLLIASSRAGGQPANLQGIWNDEVRPPWSANYTININTQNYPQLAVESARFREFCPQYVTTLH